MAKMTRAITPDDVIVAEDALIDFQFAVIKAMKDQGISQSELADKLGITRPRMSQILSSDANPTLKLVGRIIAALDLRTQYVKKSVEAEHMEKVAAVLAEMEVVVGESKGLVGSPSSDWFLPDFGRSGREWHNDNDKNRPAGRKVAAFAA